VAKDNGSLVFIEVKYRKSESYGDPSESIHLRKQKTIYRVALIYLLRNGMSEDTPSRFDVVVILGEEIKLIKNAFGGIV